MAKKIVNVEELLNRVTKDWELKTVLTDRDRIQRVLKKLPVSASANDVMNTLAKADFTDETITE